MKFKQAIEINNQVYGFTDNGAVTLKSSSDPHVDLFSLIGASRGKNITAVYDAAYKVDPELTTRIALWARDCRGGAGEREIFRQYLLYLLVTKQNEILHSLITSGKISELGRWDDYLVFVDSEYEPLAFGMIAEGLSNPQTVGLVAKWMPRQGHVAHRLAQWFRLSPRNWRKLLVRSTNVVEQKMCAREWETINFEHVPSLASARYQKAFMKHVPDQYQAFKNALVKGTAKVNASTLYPYDIIKSVAFGDETVAQAQWDALPDYIGNSGGILPILDVSGSMQSPVPGSSITMMDACVSVGLYIALRQKGDFNRVVMTFSSESKIIHLKEKTLRKLYQETVGMNWGMSTDLNKAFANLLTFAKRNSIAPEDMPKTLLVISDMQFNHCGHLTNLQAIEGKYLASGYEIPRIVFWCLNGRSGNSPAHAHQEGVALVSGFSPSIMRSVLSGKSFTPRDIMLETVMKDRYTI